jgi:hypothetical protein
VKIEGKEAYVDSEIAEAVMWIAAALALAAALIALLLK